MDNDVYGSSEKMPLLPIFQRRVIGLSFDHSRVTVTMNKSNSYWLVWPCEFLTLFIFPVNMKRICGKYIWRWVDGCNNVLSILRTPIVASKCGDPVRSQASWFGVVGGQSIRFCSERFDFLLPAPFYQYPIPVVPKVCSADPKGSATCSQGIRGYISVMATLKSTHFLN
jgi:hypothetical protein